LKKAQQKAGYEDGNNATYWSKRTCTLLRVIMKNMVQIAFKVLKLQKRMRVFIKPMNCPHHCEIYNAKPYSYKELPKRYAEFGTVYRYEQSGELHGLTRVRGFTQDDAHIFCMPEQLDEEFQNVIDLVLYVFGSLGFENFSTQVSVRDPENLDKYIGDSEYGIKLNKLL